jgi:hypothetical protein
MKGNFSFLFQLFHHVYMLTMIEHFFKLLKLVGHYKIKVMKFSYICIFEQKIPTKVFTNLGMELYG